MADKFLIAPFKNGLQDNLPSWLIPENAFTRLNNALVFRGRLKKRFGSKLTGTTTTDQLQNLNSRLRIALTGGSAVGITDGTGGATGTLPGTHPGTITEGQMFSIGTVIYTVSVLGAPADLLQTTATTTATLDNTTGQYVFAGAPDSEQIYFYTSNPIVGFSNYELGSVNDHTTYAFDKKFIYKYTGSDWQRDGSVEFKGSDSDYFWSTNWQGSSPDQVAMFITNNNATKGTIPASDDPMYYYNGTTWGDFSAITIINSGGTTISSASIIVPFKGRLVLMNFMEKTGTTNTHYSNGVAYCHIGSPLSSTAWLEPGETYSGSAATGAGRIYIPVKEGIVSIGLIKDRLIIFCERSTWEMSYTGNHAQPFIFESINSTLGSEARRSAVILDRRVVAIGTTGINSCDGAYTTRIDEEIPDKVYEILKTTEGVKKIHGTRDYFSELIYWSYLKQTHADDNIFNDSLIVYNYRNGNWSFNDDCITSFGLLEQEKELTDANASQTLLGNQQGFISVVDSSLGKNAHAMMVTNMAYADPYITLTIYNHNIRVGDFVKIEYPQGITGFTDGIYKVVSRPTYDTITITASFSGTYTGGGLVSRVSRIEAETKDMNPYVKTGDNINLIKVDFNVEKTTYGEVTIDYDTSTSGLSMITEESNTGTNFGDNTLETRAYKDGASYLIPLEEYQSKLWHEVYFSAYGEFVKLKISLSDDQMLDTNIAESTFVVNGMLLHTEKASR